MQDRFYSNRVILFPWKRNSIGSPNQSWTLQIDHRFVFQEADAKIDWWSKFYASIGDLDKAGTYLEQGYETLAVSSCQSLTTEAI